MRVNAERGIRVMRWMADTHTHLEELRVTMSRKDELLKMAQLLHSQARRTGTTGVKQMLHRMGEYFQNEAKQLKEQASPRSYDDPIRRRSRPNGQVANDFPMELQKGVILASIPLWTFF